MTAINHEPRTHKNNERTDNKKLGLSRRIKLIAGIAAGSAVIGAGSACSAEEKPMFNANYPSISGEITPGNSQDSLQVDPATYPYNGDVASSLPAFNQLPLGAQIDAVAPYVNKNIQQWWTDYLDELHKPENRGPNFTIGEPTLDPLSENNDAQTITNRSLAISQHAGWGEPNHNLALNIISAKNSPESDGYNVDIELVDNTEHTYVSPLGVYDELPMFTEGTIYKTTANGTPTKAFRVYNYDTDKTFVNIFQYVSGPETGESTWILVDQGSINDPIGKAYAAMPGATELPPEAR